MKIQNSQIGYIDPSILLMILGLITLVLITFNFIHFTERNEAKESWETFKQEQECRLIEKKIELSNKQTETWLCNDNVRYIREES